MIIDESAGGGELKLVAEIEKVYTPEQVAKHLQLNVNTIWRYINKGKLKAARIGGQYRIKKSVFEKLLDGDGWAGSKKKR